MVDFKADERLNTLNHSCAHVMAQAVKHLYPEAKFLCSHDGTGSKTSVSTS